MEQVQEGSMLMSSFWANVDELSLLTPLYSIMCRFETVPGPRPTLCAEIQKSVFVFSQIKIADVIALVFTPGSLNFS